jgi:hypothetical protein
MQSVTPKNFTLDLNFGKNVNWPKVRTHFLSIIAVLRLNVRQCSAAQAAIQHRNP